MGSMVGTDRVVFADDDRVGDSKAERVGVAELRQACVFDFKDGFFMEGVSNHSLSPNLFASDTSRQNMQCSPIVLGDSATGHCWLKPAIQTERCQTQPSGKQPGWAGMAASFRHERSRLLRNYCAEQVQLF